MTTQNVTLEQLAEKLGYTVWSKDDLKRIYLNDEGYNTKKMSTKTFIFEKDGEFIVSCRIDCPSQAIQWIDSQEQEIKDSVYKRIERAIDFIVNPEKEIEEQKLEAKEQAKWAAERELKKSQEVEKVVVKSEPREFIKSFEIGETLTHKAFGQVTVVSEDENTVTVDTNGVHKKLLKKFAPLSR